MPQDRQLNFIAFNLFVFFLAVYLVTASGTTFTDVGQLRLETAKSIIERSDLSVRSDMGISGADGRKYSWFGIGPVLLAIPLYIAGKWAGIPPENAVSIMNQLLGAATAVLIFLFSFSLGYSKRASVTVSALYGLGTMAWPYAKDSGDHILETFMVTLSVYCMFLYSKSREKRHLLFSTLALGFALTTRTTSILTMPALFVLLIFQNLKSGLKSSTIPLLKDLALFLVTVIPFVAMDLWYNHYRFGSPLETGYGLMETRWGIDYFSGKISTALLGFTVSPGKGFFYYSPVAVLIFFSIRPFARKAPEAAISFMLLATTYLLFYSKYVYWHGDNAWGPRYLFVITPFLIIPTAALIDAPAFQEWRTPRFLVLTTFVAGLAVQIASVSIHPLKYFVNLQTVDKVEFIATVGNENNPIVLPPPETYFTVKRSPLLAQLGFIRDAVRNMREYRYVESSGTESRLKKFETQPWMNVLDFWWIYKYYVDGSRAGFGAVVALLFLAGFCMWRALRAAVRTPA